MNNNFDISKCKPFDLERAINGDEVVAYDGTKFRYCGHSDECYNEDNIIGFIFFEGKERWAAFKYSDLFMLPKEKVVWVNVYKNNRYKTGIGIGSIETFETKEFAEKNGQLLSSAYIGSHPITINL